MNVKLQQPHNNLQLNISPLTSFFNKKHKMQIKSQDKEQKFFKEVFPRIFSGKKTKTSEEHTVSSLDKKVKGISLSVQTYNRYMVNYQNLLKFPTNHYYSTERLKNFIPFTMLNNTNLNKKNNFYLSLNDFRTSPLNIKGGNNKMLYQKKKFVSQTNYGIKDIWKFNDTGKYQMSDNEVFKYFIEGTFLTQPQKLKYVNIDEKKLHPHLLDKNDFDFYSTYLENLHKNENFTDNKTKEYEMCLSNKNKSKFVLEIRSICFCFEEIDIDNANNIDINKEKKKNIQKIYLPFKYLPLFFLFTYNSLKVFISEIISFQIETNQFKIIVNDKLEQIVKKYSQYCQNKINLYTLEKNEEILKDIIYYENEFHFNYIFPWIIYDNRYTDIKTKLFQFKIILPTMTFLANDSGIKFQKFTNKWIIFELIKSNFKSWDRYLLYNLFMIKKFRKTISYIINKKRNHISYEYTTKIVGALIDSKIDKKNNFDFFISKVLQGQNHYYFFTPFKATISSKYHNKYDLNDSISPQLSDSRKIYKLAKHFGLTGTFNKCMYYNKLTKKYYFTFKFLKDITKDYILSLKENSICLLNKKYKQVFKYNCTEYHLIIRECLLCEKIINIDNYSELKYYKIPDNLFHSILENDSDEQDNDIISILINQSIRFIDLEEIEEYREYFMKNNLNDSSSSISKTSKDKNKRKNKNSSNVSLRRFDIKNNTESINSDKFSLIQLKNASYDQNRKNSNKSIDRGKYKTYQIERKLSDLNKMTNLKQAITKKNSLFGKITETVHNKSRSNTKLINMNEEKNNNNIINIINNNKIRIENRNKQSKLLLNIDNKKQLELMRIKRDIKLKNSINDIERLKLNLNNNNNIKTNFIKTK